MTQELGTAQDPLRVAIVGSGPAGFYAAEHLLKQFVELLAASVGRDHLTVATDQDVPRLDV